MSYCRSLLPVKKKNKIKMFSVGHVKHNVNIIQKFIHQLMSYIPLAGTVIPNTRRTNCHLRNDRSIYTTLSNFFLHVILSDKLLNHYDDGQHIGSVARLHHAMHFQTNK